MITHPTFSHFLSTQHLTRSQILQLLQKAQTYLSADNSLIQPPPLLKDKIVANLFFENSTRTRCSFEIGAQKLGAYVLNFNALTSSAQKGETLLDTVHNLEAMGVNLFVIRHSETGIPRWIAEQLKDRAAVINAGDGTNEHPTQAMLDILTIQRHKPDFSKLIVSIIGDIRHSRVARSLCFALNTLGVTDIRLVAPSSLLPTNSHGAASVDTETCPPYKYYNDLTTGIENADVVMTLRMQHERMNKEETVFDLEDYIKHYKLTANKLRHAKSDAIVMHPGPMNRGVEIESAVADGRQSVILEQPKFGVAMRMAVMEYCSLLP